MKRFFLKSTKEQPSVELKPIKLPYCIEVINDSDEVKDAEIFGSAKYIPRLTESGNYDKDGLRISNSAHESSYLELLSAVWKDSFQISKIYIVLLDGDAKQLEQSITYKHSHPNGVIKTETFIPHKDPYQYQNNILLFSKTLEVDLLTTIGFQVMPKTHVKFIFY